MRKALNLSDLRPRTVVYTGATTAELINGEQYNLVKLTVGGFSSTVRLQGIAGSFNSVDFSEIPEYTCPKVKLPEQVLSYLFEHTRFGGIVYVGNDIPDVLYVAGLTLPLFNYKKRIGLIADGEHFVIGRKPDYADLAFTDVDQLSQIHCVISKVGNDYVVTDTSVNGTKVETRKWRIRLERVAEWLRS